MVVIAEVQDAPETVLLVLIWPSLCLCKQMKEQLHGVEVESEV